MARLIEDYREAALLPVLDFFDKTGTRLEVFKLALALPRGDDARYIRDRGSLLASLSDSGCLRYFVEQYTQGAYNRHPGGMSTTRRYARRLWFFRRRLNLQYPENVLLDMLSFDGYARWVLNSHGQNAGQHILADDRGTRL